MAIGGGNGLALFAFAPARVAPPDPECIYMRFL
jgi:hypothetical protein